MFKPGDKVLVMLYGSTIRIFSEIELVSGFYVGPDGDRKDRVLVDVTNPFTGEITKRVKVDRTHIIHA